jgi:DNA-binding response OmpR family regulator
MREKILIVDDDPQIISFLSRYLKKQNFIPLCATTGKEMREILAREKVDLCLLDVGLPDADGFELTREIRQTSNLPIIVLSVRNEAFDRIFGLEFGADDYVTKPFEPRELMARIRTVLRRSASTNGTQESVDPGTEVLQFGTWEMNIGARTLEDSDTGKSAGLTSMEFDLLKALIEHPKSVLSRDQLLNFVRGQDFVVGDRAIDVHIMRLRKKIEPDNSDPRYIKTVHGIGYYFVDDMVRAAKTL